MPDIGLESLHCLLCQQNNCDIRVSACGCTLHSTCLPIDFIFLYKNNSLICPSCHIAPIGSISLMPLPADKFEEASRLREQNPSTKSSSSTPSSQPSSKKRDSMTLASTSSMCRTGRWSTEESSLVDQLIRSFDAGLLPLPQGIKLNDFLCTLLLCRTSRLTKKLKHEKLSSRSYKSIGGTYAQGGSMSSQAGVSIQRAQALFLRTLSPAWMQTELRLNISRVWREQFEKLCMQVGFSPLDTTQWNASLKIVVSLHSEDSLEAKQKRLKQALSEDVSAAAKFGFDAGNNMSQELRLTLKKESHQANQSALVRDQLSNMDRRSTWHLESVARDLETTNIEFASRDEEPLRHVSSFGSLEDLLSAPINSRSQSKTGPESYGCDAQGDMEWAGGVMCQETLEELKSSSQQAFDGVIDSVVKEAFAEGEKKGRFLERVSNFLTSSDLNFQHCDIWVPTECTDLGAIDGQVRLTNAGNITFKRSKDPSHITKRLSEFGVYSKTLSFAPGSGLPGRVFASGQSIWMNNVHQARTDEFGLVGGARIYGVRTAVGLHVPASIGSLVVVLYSTADLVRDINVENQCMNFFRQLNPTPKWHLSIDVADEETEGLKAPQLQDQAPAPSSSSACVIPPSPVSSISSTKTSNSLNEQSLVSLLRNHSSSGNDVADNLVTLIFLLLRHPSCRSITETNQVGSIMSKYKGYVGEKYSNDDIARMITHDWSTVGFLLPANKLSHSARETEQVKGRKQLAPRSSKSSEYSRKVSDLTFPGLPHQEST